MVDLVGCVGFIDDVGIVNNVGFVGSVGFVASVGFMTGVGFSINLWDSSNSSSSSVFSKLLSNPSSLSSFEISETAMTTARQARNSIETRIERSVRRTCWAGSLSDANYLVING